MITIAVGQMEPRIGEKAENVMKTCRLIDAAAEKGAKLIILPELCNTGYVFNTRKEAFELAEPLSVGPTVGQWVKKAKEYDIYLVAGISEKDGTKIKVRIAAIITVMSSQVLLLKKVLSTSNG